MPDPYPTVAGRCPACDSRSLFVGAGGHVTCSRLDCSGPTAADTLLHHGSEQGMRFRLATIDRSDPAAGLSIADAIAQRVIAALDARDARDIHQTAEAFDAAWDSVGGRPVDPTPGTVRARLYAQPSTAGPSTTWADLGGSRWLAVAASGQWLPCPGAPAQPLRDLGTVEIPVDAVADTAEETSHAG